MLHKYIKKGVFKGLKFAKVRTSLVELTERYFTT